MRKKNYMTDKSTVATYYKNDRDIIDAYVRRVVDARMDDDTKALFKKVIFNDPATIIFWNDGTKTVVKRSPEEPWDPEKGLAMAIIKKAFGNSDSYYKTFKDILNGAACLRNAKPEEVKPITQKTYRDVILERYPWRYSKFASCGNVFSCPGKYIDGAVDNTTCPKIHDCAKCFSAPCSSTEEKRVHDTTWFRPSMKEAVLSKISNVDMVCGIPHGCPDNYIDGVCVPDSVCNHMMCSECWDKPFPDDKDGRDIHPFKFVRYKEEDT